MILFMCYIVILCYCFDGVFYFAVKKAKNSDHPNNSSCEGEPTPGLLNLFNGLSMYIHPEKFTMDQLKTYKRYFIAYDGDIDAAITDKTRIVLLHEEADAKVTFSSVDMFLI